MFYPDEIVEEIRSRNDIVSVISSYIGLKKAGSNHTGLCPFHNEKTPSFSVSGSKQMYHCFGCGVGGNVFTFIMEYENYSFVEALKLLAERANIALPEQEYSAEAKKHSDLKTRIMEINKIAAKYFYYQLKSSRGTSALEYLVGRGISEETIKQFGLGYANKYSDDLYKYLKENGYDDEFLNQTGLVTFNEKHGVSDKFWNRVIFPIMDVNNRVIAFGGRVMGDGMPKYLNSPETKVFDKSRNLYGLNIARVSRKSNIILCEGYIDVIALHQAGFQNAVASLGTAFTPFHGTLLKRYTDEVLLSFDSDTAGTQAALRAIPILKQAGLTVKVINLNPYKDPDELIKAKGTEAFEHCIQEAKSSFFYEIEIMERDYNLKDPEQKTKFFNETAKKMLVFRDELERNIYIDAVAKKYLIDVEQLRKLVNRYGGQIVLGLSDTKDHRSDTYKAKKKQEDGLLKSQKLMLTWLIEDITLFDRIKGVLGPEDFTEGICNQVAGMVFNQYEEEHKVTPARIINNFQSKEEQSEVAALFSAGIRGEMNEAAWMKALSETVIRLKEGSLDKQSQRAIELNDTSLLMEIIAKKAELKKRISL